MQDDENVENENPVKSISISRKKHETYTYCDTRNMENQTHSPTTNGSLTLASVENDAETNMKNWKIFKNCKHECNIV